MEVKKAVKLKRLLLLILTMSCLGLLNAFAATAFGVADQNAKSPTQPGQPDPNQPSQPDQPNQMSQGQFTSLPVRPPATTTPPPPPPPEAAPSPLLGQTTVSQEAFSNTVRNMMPLSPDQIRTLRYLFDQSQRAAATYPGALPPKPTSSSVIVNLSPGATPPVIRLRAGYISSLVFLDSTGEPWPISAYDLGNPKSFNIQWDQKGNTLLVQALDSYQAGNLAVMLKDHDTPVMLTLFPGQQEVDYRVDLRVPGLGPNAVPMVSGLPAVESPKLLDFLNGVPPSGAKQLHVVGGPAQAWVIGKHMIIRTPLTLLSPSWVASMSSPDGTHVYELIRTPVVLASERGKIIQLKIEGL